MLRVVLVAALVGAQVTPATADDVPGAAPSPIAPPAENPAPGPDYFAPHGDGTTVTLRVGRSRTRDQKLLIGGLAGGAALAAGVGLFFHIDSQRTASDLSADTPQNQRWSPELADRYAEGQRSGTIAIAAYVIAGGLIAGTIAAVLVTDPGTEVVEVRPRQLGASVVPGGATVQARWAW